MKIRSRKTILSSEIKTQEPRTALSCAPQEITRNEMNMFISLAVCNHLKAAAPQWVRSISKEQRAQMCCDAAEFKTIKNPKLFWFRLKRMIYGTGNIRVIEG